MGKRRNYVTVTVHWAVSPVVDSLKYAYELHECLVTGKRTLYDTRQEGLKRFRAEVKKLSDGVDALIAKMEREVTEALFNASHK